MSVIDVSAVRQDFSILCKPLPNGLPLVYLDNAATTQKPRQVIEKVVECYENYNANVHRGIHSLGDRVTTELEAAREKVREFVGAREVGGLVGRFCCGMFDRTPRPQSPRNIFLEYACWR